MESNANYSLYFFGNSSVGELAKAIDWEHHPLGPVSGWSREFKTAINLILGSKLPMFIAWGKERYFFYNDAYAVILGKKHPQALGKKFFNIWPEVWSDIEPLIHAVDRGESLYHEDLRLIVNRQGSDEEAYFTFSYSPLLSIDGEVQGLYCAVMETTARKRAEDSARGEQLKLKTIFTEAPNPIALMKGPEHRISFANKHFCTYFLAGMEQTGKSIEETIPDAKEQGFIEILDEVYQTGKRFQGNEIRFDFTSPDGTHRIFYLNFVYEPVRNHFGEIEGILAVILDVTGVVETKKRVEESEARLAFALESARMGIWGVDLSTGRINHSKGSREILGIDQNFENPSEAVVAIIHPDDRKKVIQNFNNTINTHLPYFDEYRIQRSDGEVRWIKARGHVRRDQENRAKDIIGTVVDVTEEKRNHELIKESEARLQTLAETIPQMTWRTDPSGNATYYNLNWWKNTGTAMIESLGDGWLKLIHPDDRTGSKENWRRAVEGDIEYSAEYRMRMADGSYRWHIARGVPIRDQQGRIIEWVGTSTDIEDQKRAQIEFETITNNAASALFMMDKDGKPTFMNPAAKKITGYSSLDEINDRPLHYAVHWKKPDGSHYPMEECPIDQAQSEMKKIQNHEEVFSDKEGRLFPVSFSVSPLEKNGEVVGSVLEFRDITQQKETEAKLHQAINERDISLDILTIINKVGQRLTAELNLETLVQQVIDDATRLTGAQFGVFFYKTLDTQGKKQFLNAVCGIDPERFDLIAPTFQSLIGRETVRLANISKNKNYQKLLLKDLSLKSYLSVSVLSRTGEVMGELIFGHYNENVFSSHSQMMAEGLAAQAAVAMDNARLYRSVQESVRARDEFLSIASHELKTPLTSLKLQSQLRNRKIEKGKASSFDEPNLKKMFDADAKQIERMTRLIDDMLDISRINTGKLSLQTETFDLTSLVKDLLDRYSGQINDYGSEVKLISSEEITGNWDRFRIEQVITNLLTNALRYGNKRPIMIELKQDGQFAIIKVIDQGIGIAKKNQDRIFERFERAISANDISGLGLGLFIVKQILEMHHGSIKVESALGKGSTFIVDLPLL